MGDKEKYWSILKYKNKAIVPSYNCFANYSIIVEKHRETTKVWYFGGYISFIVYVYVYILI